MQGGKVLPSPMLKNGSNIKLLIPKTIRNDKAERALERKIDQGLQEHIIGSIESMFFPGREGELSPRF